MSDEASPRFAFGRETFRSLRVPNYRLFFVGQLVSMSGTWVQTVAQGILVLRLSGGSGTVLGLTIGARFLPLLLLGAWAGVVADRYDKRRILYVTQSAAGLLAAAFAVLVATDVITVGWVCVLAAGLGVVNALDTPARQALIPELVAPADLGNAVTLNSVTANLARILGAAVGGGVTVALGVAWCFGVNALSYVVVLACLARMDARRLGSPPRKAREKGELMAGIRYVRTTPALMGPMALVAVTGLLTWEFQVSLPLMATQAFPGGAGEYATMSAAMGVGAVAGGLVSASRVRTTGRTLALSAVGWGAAVTVAAVSPTLPILYAVLALVGYGSVSVNSLAKTTLQLASEPAMRGRVMALWNLAWNGTTPIGGPVVGFVGATFGARWALAIGGIAAVGAGVATLVVAQSARSTGISTRPRRSR